jgi:hypothetical protein
MTVAAVLKAVKILGMRSYQEEEEAKTFISVET